MFDFVEKKNIVNCSKLAKKISFDISKDTIDEYDVFDWLRGYDMPNDSCRDFDRFDIEEYLEEFPDDLGGLVCKKILEYMDNKDLPESFTVRISW